MLMNTCNMFGESISPEFVEAVGAEVDGDERDVGVVHGLQLDARVCAVPCRLGEQVLQGFQHLGSKLSFLFMPLLLTNGGFKFCHIKDP